MREPAVTLTDYGLTIECCILAALVMKAPASSARAWWTAFFAFIGLASLLGGTVHGFLPDDSTFANQALWDANLIAIGCTAVATWTIGAMLTGSAALTQWVPRVAFVLLAIYATIVVFVANTFLMAIAMYLPATVLLLVGMTVAHVRDPGRGWAVGIVGLILTYAAAAVQQLKVDPHPVYFDHNALYHAIQAVALFLIFTAQSRAGRVGRAVTT